MNILSLFDGMSGCQIALKEMGINYTYFASEVDKYAIKTTQHNFPNTIQLGDVRTIDLESLPKIDLLVGGSPCQGFSFAGKQLNFNDERSKLFFEFVRILKVVKPKYFLLENVVMKKEYQDIISQHLGIEPIMINSALVSAQSRKRLYWTNINYIKQPKDQGILLKNIIVDGFVDRDKSFCITAHEAKGGNLKSYFEKNRKQLVFLNVEKTKYRKLTVRECAKLQTVPDNYFFPVSNSQAYKMLGNGFTVNVIKYILGHIDEFEIKEVA